MSDERREKGNNITLFICFILYLAFSGYLSYQIITSTMSGFSDWLPGATIPEIIQIFIAPIFISMLLVVIAIRLMPLFMKTAKLMKFGKYEIAIQKYEHEITPRILIARAFFASIFAIALSLTFNNVLFEIGVIFVEGETQSYATAALASYITPLSLIFLVPTWAMEDFGIILYKKANLEDITRETYDVMSVGSFYGYLIKGFAGITTPVMYVYLFYTEGLIGQINVMTILLLFVPFVLIGQYALSMSAYKKILPKLKKKFVKNTDLALIEAQISISDNFRDDKSK